MISKIIYIIVILFLILFTLFSQEINFPFYTNEEKSNEVINSQFHSIITSDTILTELGRWPYGYSKAVAIQGNYAFIGNGPTLQILDISNPNSLTVVGEYALYNPVMEDIQLKDSLIFITNGNYLTILDISIPQYPVKIGEAYVGANPLRISLSDSFAYVVDFNGLVSVFDISDVTQPYRRGIISGSDHLSYCFASRGRYIYVHSQTNIFLLWINATNPDFLTMKGFDIHGGSTSGFIKDSLLYIGVEWGMYDHKLKIYNISNPDTLIFVGQIDIDKYIRGITVVDSLAYIVVSSGIYVVDVSNPAFPFIRDNFVSYPGVHAAETIQAYSDQYLYTPYGTGLMVTDVSDPDSLKQTSFYPAGSADFRMAIQNNFLFAASGSACVWVLDISEPSSPQNVANIQNDEYICDLVVSDTLLFFVNWASYTRTIQYLWIYNISNPHEPNFLTRYTLAFTNYHLGLIENLTSLAKNKNLIFVTQTSSVNQDSCMELIDISDPYNPHTLSVFRSPYSANNLDVKDSIAFIATAGYGIEVVDCRNPLNPKQVLTLLNNKPTEVLVDNNYLYVNTSDSFYVFDITCPLNPILTGSTRKLPSGATYEMSFSGNFVYGAGPLNIGLVDVSDPFSPILSTVPFSNYGRNVASNEDLLVLSSAHGFYIYRNNLITSLDNTKRHIISREFRLSQNYPNPFNASTQFEFYIPRKEKVVIEIFNTIGQKIQTLVNKKMDTGKHSIYFDANHLPSGVYFYQLKYPSGVITKKMLLIR